MSFSHVIIIGPLFRQAYYCYVMSISSHIIILSFSRQFLSMRKNVIFAWPHNSKWKQKHYVLGGHFKYIIFYNFTYFFSALLSCDWQNRKIFKVYTAMIWYIYILWKDSSHVANLVNNISFTSQICLFCVCENIQVLLS